MKTEAVGITGQQWSPEAYARNARFVSDLGVEVLELLAARPGERVLDLGCGDGFLTEKLAAAGCSVTGIDSSAEQVAAARRRGLDAREIRAEALPFNQEFDAVFSNAALHWIRDAAAVLGCVHRALKPGGRFVGELGGAGNVAAIQTALYEALSRRQIEAAAVDPWFFPTAEEYRSLLESVGFTVRSIVLFPRPTLLPGDLSDWLEMFAQPFLAPLLPEDRRRLVEEVRESVRARLFAAGRGWSVDYVRLRFAAERTG